ncbi:GatB/Yqey (modular protein) [Candidatus Sulfotelmatobacter kueseliae]|uniref:GatB/Yqey (Modular protein) n=1 Tax=Candidatus Sulfotelmatobacter kueseliae TaxID=2042962 RepID=A0A2U3KFQ2_9BACT|nr:GatB/Yqey (modular protein) [Candidatus Sulfotelmatobacter kueseliae]
MKRFNIGNPLDEGFLGQTNLLAPALGINGGKSEVGLGVPHVSPLSRDVGTTTVYNSRMSLVEQIQKDIVAAMKAKDEPRLSALRMVKTALKLREVEKMSPLDDKESQAVLATLIKQRKESVEQFTKGGRQEMADKEAAEIVLIETYLPKAASEADVAAGVKAVITEMGAPTMKEMGTVMKNAMARFSAAGMRVDGKMVSEMVKRELTPK